MSIKEVKSEPYLEFISRKRDYKTDDQKAEKE